MVRFLKLADFRKVQIDKRSAMRWVMLSVLFLPFVFAFFIELIGLPKAITVSIDILLVGAAVIVAFNALLNRRLLVSKITSFLSVLVVVFFLYTFVVYLFNFQSVFYYIWGFRNNFRFFAAFFLFIAFFRLDDVEDSLKAFDIIFWIHFAVTVFQFFVLKYRQDFLGGIFGVQKGCNGYVFFFLAIITVKSLLSLMNGKEKLYICFIKLAAIFLNAALAELKAFFFIFIIVLAIASIITSFSIKKVFLIGGAALLISISYTILVALFDNFRNFLSIEFLIDSLLMTNYASNEDMGRFTSVAYICEHFLTSIPDRLFGMGLGNCDTSTMGIFNTDFYNTYAATHYSIFSISFMFIENGFIGLLIYLAFFAICFIYSFVWFKKNKGNRFFNQMGLILSILCFAFAFYNSSLRTEAGYMVYFILALPFIGVANDSDNEYMTAYADNI